MGGEIAEGAVRRSGRRLVGLGCLIKPLTDAPGGGLILWPEAGRTFGIFLINWVHTVLHLALAAYAALAFSRTAAARGFGQTVFWASLSEALSDGQSRNIGR